MEFIHNFLDMEVNSYIMFRLYCVILKNNTCLILKGQN